MRRKKKPQKKRTSPLPNFAPEEEALAASLLKGFKNAEPAELLTQIPNSRVAQAIIERMSRGDGPPIPLLLAIKDNFRDKQVQKTIKRALFRLKQRGISVGEFLEPEETPSHILKPPKEEEASAHIGPILNAHGYRSIIITHYRASKGRYSGIGFVSDEDGIHEFLYGTFSKKRTQEMKSHLSEKTGPLIETSLSHAATILEDAYQRHVKIHTDAPSDYLDLRPWLLETTTLLDHPVVYEFISEDAAKKTVTDSQLKQLFQHKLMEPWIIDFERLRPFIEDILKADDSPIVLTEGQKLDQISRIKGKCINELFSSSKQLLFKRRLEEMAYVFFKLHEEAQTQLCLEAALSLDLEDRLLRKNPVIEFFLERSLDFYMKQISAGTPDIKTPKDVSSPSIIIP